jgi:hypothetical protein
MGSDPVELQFPVGCRRAKRSFGQRKNARFAKHNQSYKKEK